MKQIYYVIQTLLRGRGSNIIKVISLGLGLTMSILLFSRVAYEQSFDTCFKDYDNLYQVWSIFSVKGERFEPQEWNCGPVAGAILENFPKEVESAVSLSTSMVSAPLYNGSVRLDDRKIAADSLFFRTMGIDVLNGNPEKDLVQKDIIFLSERFARKVFGEENPIGKTLNYDHQFDLTVKESMPICLRTPQSIRKRLSRCLPCGAATGITTRGAGRQLGRVYPFPSRCRQICCQCAY